MIKFHDVKTTGRGSIQSYTLCGDRMNCDLSFANIISWRFLYSTQIAEVDGLLVFRFYTGYHLTYMAPVWRCKWDEAMRERFVAVIRQMRDDAITLGHPFSLSGVCSYMVSALEETFPNTFFVKSDRDHFDYIYTREKLATLFGKKFQSERNHCSKFHKSYPNYKYHPLTKEMIPECIAVEENWRAATKENSEDTEELSEELRSTTRVFGLWDGIGAIGSTIWVDGKLIAFTFGCPITGKVFDVCMEKADTACEGAFSIINQEFAQHLPEQYEYMNHEEDLGLKGLRYAELSCKPDILLEKSVVMEKYPLTQEETQEQIKEETVALWRDTFHDAEPFIQLYFSCVFKPEYNIICQVEQHTVAALQASPYAMKYYNKEVHTTYISGVSVREEFRKQNMDNNLMSQAHFRLYHKDVVFALLTPTEEWFYDWYSCRGYICNITCTPPPADVDNMDFSTFNSWQRAKDCVLLHNEEGFEIIKEDYRVSQSTEPDACVETRDIPGMIRTINAEKVLQLYAKRHPEHTENIRVYNDSDIPMNNIYFEIKYGYIVRTNYPLPDTRSLIITELVDYISKDDNLEMNLMLN